MGFNQFGKNAAALILVTAISVGCSKSGDSESAVKINQATSSDPELAAKVDGKTITLGELDQNVEVFQAKLELFNARKKAVEEMARKKALEVVAGKKKLSVDEYLKSEMDNAKKKVSDAQLNAFLKKMGAPDNLPADRKEDARRYVHVQNIIAAATKNSSVDIYFKRPPAPKLDLSFEGDAAWGNEDAPITVVEFSDFQCPYCAKGNETIEQLKKEYGKKKLRVVFKHFPLPSHPEARPASEASMCANEQSPDKFWKFHDLLFANQRQMKESDLFEHAKKVGVDMKKFEECFKSKKYAAHVERNLAEGQKVGVDSTPSFFVNGQPIRGARPLADFKEIIDQELAVN